jgi:N-methylhydantoinase B
MFHPVAPAPCFLYGWPAIQSIEVIYDAVAKTAPERVPAWSGGDICSLVWWGIREDSGEPWADGFPQPVGQGGHVRGDGGTLMHIAQAATRFSPIEVWEARNPWMMERVALAPDSCGAGKYRGGLGLDMSFHLLEDADVTAVIERCETPPWGLVGGLEGRPNDGAIRYADATQRTIHKATRVRVPKGATLDLFSGGGGGFGPPSERDPAAVLSDLREGYISQAHARKHYGHAFAEGGVRPAAE